MIPPKLLMEIQQLPLSEMRELAEHLKSLLREQEQASLAKVQNEEREDEFERYLLAKGLINQIPACDEADEEFDAFDPIKVRGESLSTTIIRERR